jgi:peptidoglycan hydrolase-like protein with peptidoglycan-binding domain
LPVIGNEETPPKRHTMNDVQPTVPMTTPSGMVATAYSSDSATDIPSSLDVEAIDAKAASSPVGEPDALEDTHAHAFNPATGVSADQESYDTNPRDSTAKVAGHAIDEENRPEPSVVQVEAVEPFRVPESPAARAASIADAPAATELEPVGRAAVPAALKPVGSKALLAASPVKAPPEAAPVAAASLPEINTPPTIVAAKLRAGAKEAAILAAEPRSTAPLRILVTRRTKRDRIIGVQHILSELGYLEPQDFDGTFGRATANAIKAFQKANDMAPTGAFNDELVAKVYQVAGKGVPPEGHLFVRQEFGQVFDAPVSFKDPETPLGTHVFIAMKFNPGDTSTQWMTMSVQGDDAAAALDRLEIPNDLRRKISERLTPGSSLIIADLAINTAGLKKGNDFVVWAKDMPAKVTEASLETSVSSPPRKKIRRTIERPAYSERRGSRRGPFWPF